MANFRAIPRQIPTLSSDDTRMRIQFGENLFSFHMLKFLGWELAPLQPLLVQSWTDLLKVCFLAAKSRHACAVRARSVPHHSRIHRKINQSVSMQINTNPQTLLSYADTAFLLLRKCANGNVFPVRFRWLRICVATRTMRSLLTQNFH